MVGTVENRKAGTLPPSPIKVAIVGGGCAGLSVAWQLSKLKGYQVDVYERSWRLGGKGASGRDAEGRIHEHGLHIWLGFYENAFRMMRECYDAVEAEKWGPDAAAGHKLAHGSLAQAFFAEPHIGVAIPGNCAGNTREAENHGSIWSGHFPPALGMPGDPLDDASNPFTVSTYLVRCFALLRTLMLSSIAPPEKNAAEEPSRLGSKIDLGYAFDPTRSPDELIAWAVAMLRAGVLTGASVLYQAAHILKTLLDKLDSSPDRRDQALLLMLAVVSQSRLMLRDVVSIDRELGWKNEVIDLVMTIAIGLYKDLVLFQSHGFDAINHVEYRDWLRQHGATDEVLQSRFLAAFYDLTFAYGMGETMAKNRERATHLSSEHPQSIAFESGAQLAAGVALRGALRMFFTYRGAMFWRMRSGMGDAVFAPLYRVLLQRGVDFHFEHTLRGVRFQLDAQERFVTRLNFEAAGDPELLSTQRNPASVNGSPVEGIALDHFGCWPVDDHQFKQAHDAGPNALALKAGADFDVVVFATGIDDFVALCGDSFFEAMPQWKSMRDNVKTVATQAAQVWMDVDLDTLGWRRGSGVFTGFDAPFETWADMTHTLATERAWRKASGAPSSESDRARSVTYFCGVLADKDIQAAAQEADLAARRAAQDNADASAKQRLCKLLERDIARIWPAAFTKDKSGNRPRVLATHAQANFQGSDRYTLSLPGSIAYRISPLDSSVLNMVIAGDWTANGLDAGCVEGAVMSGMLAAYAITGTDPDPDSIVGYHHP